MRTARVTTLNPGASRQSVFGALAAMVLLSTLAGNTVAADNPQAAPTSPASTLADAVRGGWVSDSKGVQYIFVLKVLDGVVSGIHCQVDCRAPASVAVLENGSLTADGVRFQIHRLAGKGPKRIDVVGRLSGAELVLTAANRAQWTLTLHRDPRKPAPLTVEDMLARRGMTSGPLVVSVSPNPYVPPGPKESIVPSELEGLWVHGYGPDKQHFIFRQVGRQLLGYVCGPCDNPYYFGVIDNVAILNGQTLTFDINHTDWGIGIEYGPFANHVTATISDHEMHLHSVAHNGPHTVEGDMVLTGAMR